MCTFRFIEDCSGEDSNDPAEQRAERLARWDKAFKFAQELEPKITCSFPNVSDDTKLNVRAVIALQEYKELGSEEGRDWTGA